MKTLSLFVLGAFLTVFNASADLAFSRKVNSYAKETPKESRVSLRASTVKLPEFDGVKLDMPKADQIKVTALFKYLKRKDKAAWEFVKKNISTVKIMEKTHRRYLDGSYAYVSPYIKTTYLRPDWVNEIKPNDKVPLLGDRVTTVVHEASHADLFNNQGKYQHTEEEADVYRKEVQARIDANPL